MRPNIDEGLKARCDSCGAVYSADDLADIESPSARLTAGEEVPAGQCTDPECGALCYIERPGPVYKIDGWYRYAEVDEYLTGCTDESQNGPYPVTLEADSIPDLISKNWRGISGGHRRPVVQCLRGNRPN